MSLTTFSENASRKVHTSMTFVFIFSCSITRCHMDSTWRCINRSVTLRDNVIESGFASDGSFNVNSSQRDQEVIFLATSLDTTTRWDKPLIDKRANYFWQALLTFIQSERQTLLNGNVDLKVCPWVALSPAKLRIKFLAWFIHQQSCITP